MNTLLVKIIQLDKDIATASVYNNYNPNHYSYVRNEVHFRAHKGLKLGDVLHIYPTEVITEEWDDA